ncbi:hypothetical protein FHX64_000736 [Microbacter margulisiae]|uniref:Uncharacterized protein n=1 Tax=Microbacter margulisiae TaxID=1350067 RepID=A0A7W5H0H7_9PORP|nr:hypothetical protein [Microbacter margulisiae]
MILSYPPCSVLYHQKRQTQYPILLVFENLCKNQFSYESRFKY